MKKQPLVMLGGLTAEQFLAEYWQKKPLLVRQAWPGVQPPIGRAALFDLGVYITVVGATLLTLSVLGAASRGGGAAPARGEGA